MASLNERQLAALAETTGKLEDAGIRHWLFGGWAVDFAVGRITREHTDVDLALRVADHERALALLHEAGWEERAYEYPAEGSRHERDGVRLELTLVDRSADGTWRTPGRWQEHPWPEQPFGDTALTLDGVTCPVIELGALVALKEAFIAMEGAREASERDALDLALLRTVTH